MIDRYRPIRYGGFPLGEVGVTEPAGPAVGAIGETLDLPAVVADYVVMTTELALRCKCRFLPAPIVSGFRPRTLRM